MPLAKVTIEKLDSSGNPSRTPDDSMTFEFNPTQYSTSKAAGVVSPSASRTDPSVNQHAGGREQTYNLELLLDDTDRMIEGEPPGADRRTVRQRAGWLIGLVSQQPPKEGKATAAVPPPHCRISWGEASTDVDIENVQVTYTLFSESGTPIRARVSLSMRRFVDPNHDNRAKGVGTTKTRSRIVRRGETLAGIAAQELGDPALWRMLADHNGLADPRRLPPGRPLLIPTT